MNADERLLVTFLKLFDPIVCASKLITIYYTEFVNLLCGNFVYFSITFRRFHAVSLCVFNKQYFSDVETRIFVFFSQIPKFHSTRRQTTIFPLDDVFRCAFFFHLTSLTFFLCISNLLHSFQRSNMEKRTDKTCKLLKPIVTLLWKEANEQNAAFSFWTHRKHRFSTINVSNGYKSILKFPFSFTVPFYFSELCPWNNLMCHTHEVNISIFNCKLSKPNNY